MKKGISLQKENYPELKQRINIFLILGGIFFAIIFLRLWYLQIAKGEYYQDLSENNRIRVVKIPAPRGKILDRRGRVLVENRPAFSLSIIPEDIADFKGLQLKLQGLLNMDPAAIARTAAKYKGYPRFKSIKLKRDIDWEEVSLIEVNRLDLPGTIIEIESRRNYLYGDFACHLLGYLGEITEKQLNSIKFANYRRGDLLGVNGSEEAFEQYLRGKEGGCQVEVDSVGRELRVLKEIEPTPGRNILLTIDLELQRLAEKVFDVKAGALIAINPQNGSILAMVNRPAFNPNLFANRMSQKQWNCLIKNPFRPLENKAIQGQYPPGSTFKIITAAAGLEEKIIDSSTKYFCSGTYHLGRHLFYDWKEEGHGIVDIHIAMVESCDCFFYELGRKLGVDKIARYAKEFGLGKKTGFNLKGEMTGLVPSSVWKLKKKRESWQTGETLSVSIGQGFLLVTPIQIISMISTIANGGKIYRPQILKRIETAEGIVVKEFSPIERKRSHLSKETIRLIKNALKGAVNDRRATGWRARIKGIEVAGKTGTAQVVRVKRGEEKIDDDDIPYNRRDHAWFAAFAPKEEPRIAVVVLVEHGGHGGSTSAPIAREVIARYLNLDNKTHDD